MGSFHQYLCGEVPPINVWRGSTNKCVGRYCKLLGAAFMSLLVRFYESLKTNFHLKDQIMLTLVNDYGVDLEYLFFDRCG